MADKNEEPKDSRFSIVSDFYIDFLGSLVPGLFAIVLAGSVLVLSVVVLCQAFRPEIPTGKSLPPPTQNSILTETPDLWLGPYGTTVIALVLAYVVGSVFYRQDPKVPDHLSAKLIWKRTKSKEDRERLAVQPTRKEDITPHDAQFPYFFLHEYLTGRGLDHLAALIPWKGRDPHTWKYRTKMFINVLKIRLQFLVSGKCKDIVRNEAHVRMATSVWYATRWVMAACAIALIVVLVAGLRSKFHLTNHALIAVFAFDLLVLFIAVIMKLKIEKFLNYLRVREVVYVLETAYFANANGFNMRFSDLGGVQTNRRSDRVASPGCGEAPRSES